MRREERGKKGERREESGEESGGRSADSWPSRDGARERSPAGLERVGTFRRKLATTCSKGYLYTWCTSTVTPIPARSPRRSERPATRTLRGPQASKRQRPKGRGFSLFPPLSNFRNFIVHSEKQTGCQTPAPFRQRPVWEPRGRGGVRREVPGAAPPSPAAPAAPLPRSRGAVFCSPGLGDLCFCVTTSPGATE